MASDFLTLDDVDVAGKRVLVRGDLNVPVENGAVGDTTRLTRFLKTIRELKNKKARVIILSHFGRPKNASDKSMSLAQVVPVLAKLLGEEIAFCEETVGPKAEAAVNALKPGSVLVLENTRFLPGEEKNDPVLAKQMAALGDLFVNDAFSVSHRAHVSTAGLAALLPSCAGRDMQEELEALSHALDRPQRPVMAIVGGSKISTKIAVLKHLIARVDRLVLGGAMANTFLAAQGKAVGKSLYEPEMLDVAREIMDLCGENCKLILPSDVVVADGLKPDAVTQIVSVDAIPSDKMALDVGPQTVKVIEQALSKVKTIVWNGPFGAFEIAPFDRATLDVAKTVAKLTQSRKLLSVAGGGDTVAALNRAGVGDKLSYVSAAGGAFLEWMEGRTLPGIEALRRDTKAVTAATR
jgi:phosphoglycerate kinase